MKTTNLFRLAMVIALMSISISSYGEIINLTGTSGYYGVDYDDYDNDMDLECYINTNTYQPVTISYNYDAEPYYDYLVIYEFDQNGNEIERLSIQLTGSGSVTTTLPNGRAKVHITTDGSICYLDGSEYTGFSFSWQAESSNSYDETQVTSSNATITGNLGVGIILPQTRLHIDGPIRGNGAAGSLTVNTIYGNVTMGAASSSQAVFTTDRSMYTFDKTMQLNNGILSAPYYTNLSFKTGGTTRMAISGSNNYVGIGTETLTQALNVKGNLSLSPSGTTPIENYNGSLMITRPTTKNQFINLVKGSTAWSIGIKNDNYSVGMAKSADGIFSPSLVISSDKKVGIGTEALTQALNIKGALSLSPSGITPNEGFNGNLMITKPAASGQYINFVRDTVMPWSIGMVYNTSNFAIGQGKENDNEFSTPPFVISPEGYVGIGEPLPYHKLHVRGDMYLRSDDFDSYPGIATNHFYWQGHCMMMGTKPGDYCHNILMLQPGGSDQGELVSSLQLWHAASTTNKDLRIQLISSGDSYFNGGNIGIGTKNPQYLLDVKGIIRATEVKIQSIGQFYADFVFAKDYALPTLKEVDSFIQTNGHLPDVPSAAEVKENGINLVEMQVKLLQKVEELTLYTIKQQKLIEEQSETVTKQQVLIEKQTDVVTKQQKQIDDLRRKLNSMVDN